MSVRKEDNGTWTVQTWFLDYNGDRRHKTRRGFATVDEAAAWEEEFLGRASNSVSSTFERYYEVYMRDMKPRLRETTYTNQQGVHDQGQDLALLRRHDRR